MDGTGNQHRSQRGRLVYVALVTALVFAGQLMAMLGLPLFLPLVPAGLPQTIATAAVLSVLVVALILPYLLRLTRKMQYAEQAIDSTNEGYWVIDAEGNFRDVNPGYSRMMGYPRERIMQMCIADFEAVATMEQIRAQIQRILAKGNERFETRHRHADGHWVDLEITVTGVDNRYLVAFLRDISARKVADAALRAAMASADQANRAKSEFLANMSHEIRTPMNGVLGLTELVLDSPLEPQQREYLAMVKESAQSLLVILNDILDLSKIEAGMLTIEQLPYAPAEVLQSAVQATRARADAKGLALHCTVNKNMPAQVVGDPVRLRQIVLNLCDNAIKFTASGSVSLQAEAEASDSGGWLLRVQVRDTGIGIAPDKQAAIFQAFTQADTSTTRQYGGTGLGLTICVRLAELMGGHIRLESQPGQGSCFELRVQVQAAAAPAVASPQPAVTAAAPTRPLHILLAEDHPINQRLAMTLLARWGHTVVLAHDGVEAVEQFGQRRWDLVLMDMQMPRMGGLDATRALRVAESGRHHTPIVAMTANAMEADREACLAAGMDDFLSKPIDSARLKALQADVSAGALSSASGEPPARFHANT